MPKYRLITLVRFRIVRRLLFWKGTKILNIKEIRNFVNFRPYEGTIISCNASGFGGLEVACWPLIPKFVGSNPAEAVRFFRAKKSSARLPSEGK